MYLQCEGDWKMGGLFGRWVNNVSGVSGSRIRPGPKTSKFYQNLLKKYVLDPKLDRSNRESTTIGKY